MLKRLCGTQKMFLLPLLLSALLCTLFPAYAQEESPLSEEEQIRQNWAEIRAAAVEVPFENLLAPGEELVTDGSVNYIPRLEALMQEAHRAYLADGKYRVIKFPAGTFDFPAENPTVPCVSGVGFRGAGKTENEDGTYTYLTRLTPAQTILGTNPAYGNNEIHSDVILDCLEIDCSKQEINETISKFWYQYKAIYVQRVDNWWMNDIYAHDSLGTLFGLDYLYSRGIYHIDCHAENSGRGTTANTSGPGAGFGITSGRSQNEPCKFVGCIAENCKTGGYYFEIRSNQAEMPTGYSVLNSKAFGCSFGIDDQGVDNLIIEDCEFYGNSCYGIRRGAVNPDGSGAGAKGLPGSMYCRRTKIYANGSTSNPISRSAGVGYTERCQVTDKNDSCQQVFTDCEIFHNRGYGIANTYSLPRFLLLSGNTKIYNNGGSGIHFRRGKVPSEKITIRTEGDRIEIYNNGNCGEESLWSKSGSSATGVYGDGVTLSADSDNNHMQFKAYGNQGRAVAFRPYMGQYDYSITGGVYSGDWTGQTNGLPWRDEIGATDTVFSANISSGIDTETYTNYAYNGNGNPAGSDARNIKCDNAVITKESDAENGSYFKMFAAADASGSNRRFFTTFSENTPKGVVPLNTMTMSSVCIKANKDLTARSTGNASFGSSMSEYRDQDPLCQITIPKDTWVRVDMANACISKDSAPIFGLCITDSDSTTDTEILVKNIMCIDKPDILTYFDGAEGGGEWIKPQSPYNCASVKTVPVSGLPPQTNRAPSVSAGEDQTVSFASPTVSLSGTVRDDGKPEDGRLTIQWTQESGPDFAVFSDSGTAATTVTFPRPGSYSLKLTGNDGALSASDSVTITVTPFYPVIIKQLYVTDGQVLGMETVIDGTLTENARGIAAVYDQAGNLLSTASSDNMLTNEATGAQQLSFDPPLKLDENTILKAFVWASDENAAPAGRPLAEVFVYTAEEPPPEIPPIIAAADAYTRGGANAEKNYGTGKLVDIKNDANADYYRRGYLKFDLAAVTQPVQKATLRLYGYVSGSASAGLDLYQISDDSWTETGLTAASAPAMTEKIGSLQIGNTTQYYEIDVTDFVNAQLQGDKMVSFGLDCAAVSNIFHFNSREADEYPPTLLLE